MSPHIFSTVCIPCSERLLSRFPTAAFIPNNYCSTDEEPERTTGYILIACAMTILISAILICLIRRCVKKCRRSRQQEEDRGTNADAREQLDSERSNMYTIPTKEKCYSEYIDEYKQASCPICMEEFI